MEDSALPVARIIFGDAQTLLFAGQTLSFGRSADNDCVLDDPKVSRSHAVLEWNGMGFSLRDLDSVNGSYVNGERVQAAARPLRDGDELAFHTFKFRYLIERAPVEPSADVDRLITGQPPIPQGPRLLVIAGPDQGQQYPLWGEQITVGRASQTARSRGSRSELPVTWEIRLTDRSVSRPHARLERRAECFYLIDLESANGTLLNGRLITGPVPLAEGDLIVVGETHLRFATN